MNIRHFISFLASSAMGLFVVLPGCAAGAVDTEEEGVQESTDEGTTGVAAQAINACSTAENAGPIWSNSDSYTKCPSTCANVGRAWDGNWWTTVPGQMSVCECALPATTAVEAGPIWNNADSNGKCPSACANAGRTWDGNWWTTVPGQMSVCECAISAEVVEAGPIWNNADSNGKCPSACSSVGRTWDGNWWTTIPGQMSVCECGC